MANCPRCGKEWPPNYRACPDDGSTLIPVSQGATHGQAEAALAAEETSSNLPPGTVVGEYRVEGKLGEGGMGAVYSATHPLIGKKAAIKVISPALSADASAVERFIQEARAVNQIGHPNIVDVFSFGSLSDGRSYFVMEWLHGETLAERLARGQLSLGEAVEILDQISDALEAAHEKQIVHRDLKPDNVYLVAVRASRQIVKLLDFGIAKLTDDNDGRLSKTRTGMMMGTPGYISPEQARGKNVDWRTDLYALGAMAFEMMLGRLPFVADNAMDIVLKHMTEPPPVPSTLWPEIPPSLDDILVRMLAKDPAIRPSLSDFRTVLVSLRGSPLYTAPVSGLNPFPSGLVPRPLTPAPSTYVAARAPLARIDNDELVPPRPKKKVGLILGVAAALGLVVVGVAVTQRKSEAPSATALPSATAPVAPPSSGPEKTAAPEPKTGVIAIRVDVPNARIGVDGRVATESAGEAKVSVDRAGEHKIHVTAPGRKAYSGIVDVELGSTASVVVALEKLGETKPPKTPARSGPKPTKPDSDRRRAPPPGEDYTLDPFGNKMKSQ